jgi:Skp family chaperone for outer membrane proteins
MRLSTRFWLFTTLFASLLLITGVFLKKEIDEVKKMKDDLEKVTLTKKPVNDKQRLSTPSTEGEMKIGIVNMSYIFSEFYKTKDAQMQYNSSESSANKEINERLDLLKKEMESVRTLEAELEKTDLSKEAHEIKLKEHDEKLSKVRALDRETAEFRSAKQKKLQEQFLVMRKDIIDEIMKVVNEQTHIRGYDIVLDKSGLSAGAVPVVLYSRPDLDISNSVITILNKKNR